MKKIFFILFMCSAFKSILLAQPDDRSYYKPYNFPQNYESDRFNKNLTVSFSLPFFLGKYNNVMLYSDFTKIRIFEFLNLNFGAGASVGFVNQKDFHYSVGGKDNYTLNKSRYVKLLVGGGLTFRLANPINFSIRSGVTTGYEYYQTSEVYPLLSENKSSSSYYDKTYTQTANRVKLGYFYSISMFVKIKNIGLSVSRGSYFLATGNEVMNSVGIVFPIGN